MSEQPALPFAPPKTLFLVDGSNQAFRAFFAIQTDMRAPDGFPTRGLYGFANMLRKMLRDHSPDYVAVVFDEGLSFRNQLYPEYKGQRPDMPEDLRLQWPEFRPFCEEWGMTALAEEGWEADDIIGTLAVRFAGPNLRVRIVSTDKDFGQLVGPYIQLQDVARDILYDPPRIEQKWGVGPGLIIDLLALMGDTSDNVPGVPGVGAKTAAKLLLKYDGLDGVVSAAQAGGIKGKRGAAIAECTETIALARKLVTIHLDWPNTLSLDDLAVRPPDYAALQPRLARYRFRRLLAEAEEALGQEPSEASGPGGSSAVAQDDYRVVDTVEGLAELVAQLRAAGRFAFDTETTSLDARGAELVGMSFCWDDKFAVYVPIGHIEGPNCPGAVAGLAPLLADPELKKVGQNLKYDLKVLRANGLDLQGIDGDTMLADYLLQVDRKHSLDELAARVLDHKMMSYKETTADVDGEFARVPVADAARYAAEDAHVVWLLEQLMPLDELESVYRDIELPLISVLAGMELEGIGIDVEALGLLSTELGERVDTLRAAAQEEAGRPINLNSPKQLRVVLFEERGLKPIKRTKTGPSTDAASLQAFAAQGDALSQLILEFREVYKLKSTYVDALPGTVADDGRIHTHFHQAVAATGRLSSNAPNLQNIPIRTAAGRRIRDCFVAREGHTFLSADYSQIELRVLAHFCKEGGLVDAFRARQDIHRRTASEIFEVPIDQVSDSQRRAAKAINFGLVYGMSAFRLANDLGISRGEASSYIESYFARYPQVRAYMDGAVEEAKKTGYARTMYGRRRPVRGLDSRRPQERGAAERIAINTPVQGSAADLIKLAMLRVHRRLETELPGVKLLLQVHDELVLEVPDELLEDARALVVAEMEAAAELVVPLVVDTGEGRTWNDAH